MVGTAHPTAATVAGCDKLKRALKAEVDEEAWSALYSSISRPFPSPARNGKPGKIAIKVINHYGDEVLKVYEGS